MQNMYKCLIWYLEHTRSTWLFVHPQRKKMISPPPALQRGWVEQFRQLVGSRVAVVRSCRHLSKQLRKWEPERRGSVVKGAISLPPKQSPGSRWPFAPQSFCLLRLPGVRVRQPVECTVVTEFLQRLLWFLIIPSRLCNKVRTRI